MTDERLGELERQFKEHFEVLSEEYDTDALTNHKVSTRIEREAWELLQALKAERATVKALEAQNNIFWRYVDRLSDPTDDDPLDKIVGELLAALEQ